MHRSCGTRKFKGIVDAVYADEAVLVGLQGCLAGLA